jgi:hypothetical protein
MKEDFISKISKIIQIYRKDINIEMKTGITIVRCIYNNRIVIGVDTRTTKEHIATDLD